MLWFFQLCAKASKIASALEEARYSNKRAQAVAEFDKFCSDVSLSSAPQVLTTRGFKWRADPIHGLLDYVSTPWVTWLKQCGDCDDFARLYLEIAKKQGILGGYCFSALKISFPRPKGHAVFIRPMTNSLNVFSNLGPSNLYSTEPEIATAFVPGWTHAFAYDENMKIERMLKA